MKQNPPSLQEKMARLRARFVAQLPERMEELGQQLQGLAGESDARMPTVVSEIHRILHSLKGTGASFRLPAFAEAATRAEALAMQLGEAPVEQHAALIEALHKAVTALQSAVEELACTDAAGTGAFAEMPGFEMNTRRLPTTEGRTRTIYICDDEPDQVTHLSYQLRCFGYQVRHFTDTDSFHQAVLQQAPDAIIMDVRFPQGSTAGTEALARVQEIAGCDFPAVVLSGRDDFEARLSAVRAGAQAYFTKPARPIDLVTALDEIMGEQVEEPFRVLVVDDEPEVAQYHALILEAAGMLVSQLNHPERILDVLREFRPDLVLTDVYMPGCTGQEMAALIRQLPEHLGLPIVYLSSETDRRKQFSVMQVGVEGFITKPVVPEELVSAVSLRAERMRTLRALMARDSLTGFYNHTTTTELIRTSLNQARREEGELSMVMLDLDKFKVVNDTYGHVAGDQVLLALARLLRQRLRSSDIVGRYGGEEFAILLHGVAPEDAKVLMNQLREDFARIRFSAEHQHFYCTFSAGISAYPDYTCAEELRIAADKALYHAKRSGRNCVMLEQDL